MDGLTGNSALVEGKKPREHQLNAITKAHIHYMADGNDRASSLWLAVQVNLHFAAHCGTVIWQQRLGSVHGSVYRLVGAVAQRMVGRCEEAH